MIDVREHFWFPRIKINHTGLNGFVKFPLAPKEDISYIFDLAFNADGSVSLSGAHDGYPSYEVWVYRDDEDPEELYTFEETEIRMLGCPLDVEVSVGPNAGDYCAEGTD